MSMGARTKPDRGSAKIVVPSKGSTGGTGPAKFDGRENMRAPKGEAVVKHMNKHTDGMKPMRMK